MPKYEVTFDKKTIQVQAEDDWAALRTLARYFGELADERDPNNAEDIAIDGLGVSIKEA